MGQFSWDSVVLSRDVKGKGFGETCGSSQSAGERNFQSVIRRAGFRVSGRAELPVELAEERNFQSISGRAEFPVSYPESGISSQRESGISSQLSGERNFQSGSGISS